MWLLWSAAVSRLWGLVLACVGRRRLVDMSSDCGSQYSCLLFPAVPPIQPMTLGESLPLWALLSVIKSLHPKLFPVICLWSTLTSQIQSTAKKKKKKPAVVTVHLKSQIKCVISSWAENENAVIIDDWFCCCFMVSLPCWNHPSLGHFSLKINKGSFAKNGFHLVNNFDLCNYFCDFS